MQVCPEAAKSAAAGSGKRQICAPESEFAGMCLTNLFCSWCLLKLVSNDQTATE